MIKTANGTIIPNNFKHFFVLLILVFCCSNPAIGENLYLRVPLGNYAGINYAELLSKGDKVDPITKTVILTGEKAKAFLLQTENIPYQTTVCNLGDNRITMELEGDRLTLEHIGAISIKPQTNLEFKEIAGQVVVIVTQNPDGVNNWYKVYNSENFPELFKDMGYNKSGIISSEAWTSKGVVVIDSTDRKNQWSGKPDPEWLIDSMTEGAGLAGLSMVQYDKDTGDKLVFFTKIRPTEAFHHHPNKFNGNFIEIYCIEKGMAALAFVENGETKVNIMEAGDIMIVKNEMSHAIIAAKGPYKHLVIQLPSTFQYGFAFKQPVDLPQILQRLTQSVQLNEILGANKTGTYIIEEDVNSALGIRSQILSQSL